MAKIDDELARKARKREAALLALVRLWRHDADHYSKSREKGHEAISETLANVADELELTLGRF